MTTQATTQGIEGRAKRRSALLLGLGMALAGVVDLGARQAEAAFPRANGRIAFVSERATGTGVDNPTGDQEIFTIKLDGTGITQRKEDDDQTP